MVVAAKIGMKPFLRDSAAASFTKPKLPVRLLFGHRFLRTLRRTRGATLLLAVPRLITRREAAKRMIPRKRGKIINIGSLTSELARATVAPYTVAKGGIKMLTRAMTAEWASHNIQANAIGPGYMLTDMNQALIDNPEFDAWVKSRTPARRWGKPEELIGVAVFLASAASDYVSGQIIYVDGGMVSVL
jgi:gluconate 5-dehydrogenase